jgi:hypothetical protein
VRPELIRPDDLLNLIVETVNLEIDRGDPERPLLTVADPAQSARLVVTFPPQTIAESAYFEGSGIPPDPPPVLPPGTVADPDAGRRQPTRIRCHHRGSRGRERRAWRGTRSRAGSSSSSVHRTGCRSRSTACSTGRRSASALARSPRSRPAPPRSRSRQRPRSPSPTLLRPRSSCRRGSGSRRTRVRAGATGCGRSRHADGRSYGTRGLFSTPTGARKSSRESIALPSARCGRRTTTRAARRKRRIAIRTSA